MNKRKGGFDEVVESSRKVFSQPANSEKKTAVEISGELVHNTFLHLHWSLKAFNLSVTFLSPPSLSSHQPDHRQFLSARFVSFLLRFPDIITPQPPPSLLPLHYVIMIIAHRGLRKLNFPFRSGSFMLPVSLCAASPSPHDSLQAWTLLLGHLIKYTLNVCMCVFGPFPLKIESVLPNPPLPTTQ